MSLKVHVIVSGIEKILISYRLRVTLEFSSSNSHTYKVYNLRTLTVIKLINAVIYDSRVTKLIEFNDNEIFKVWDTPKNVTDIVKVSYTTLVDSSKSTEEENEDEQEEYFTS